MTNGSAAGGQEAFSSPVSDVKSSSMIKDALFLIVMWAVTAFLANRIYVIVRYRAINIKGVTYSKAETPVMYWIQMVILVCGLAMIEGIAVLATLGCAAMLA